jgi:organic radical activating enzyme
MPSQSSVTVERDRWADVEIFRPVVWEHGRVFVDIATAGCGSGCSYCYLSKPEEPATYLSENQVSALLDDLTSHSDFIPGQHGTLVSLSPGTEPLRNSSAVRNTRMILEKVLPLGNPVQLPTKERIPNPIIEVADSSTQFPGQLVVFLSLATMTRSPQIEPGAAGLVERLKNIDLVRGTKLRISAYIKPFLRSAVDELDDFITTLNKTQPNFICLGMRYYAEHRGIGRTRLAGRSRPFPLRGEKHPVKTTCTAEGVTPELISFSKILRQRCAPIPVFLTSTCVSAYAADREPPQRIWITLPVLCVRCRSCGTS